jgi:hypothetical protein
MTAPLAAERQVQRGRIDRWALSGRSLQSLRQALQVDMLRLAAAMGVSWYRVEQLEAQARVTRETAERYHAAVIEAWQGRTRQLPIEQKRARDERRELERQRERERYAGRHQARDQERDDRERWTAFLREFKAGAVAAFCDQCIEASDDVQPDAAGEELADLYQQLAREHHARASVAELVQELERRGLMMRAGSVEVLVQVRDRAARGQRPGPPRMSTAHRPAYDVWCRLSPFGRRLALELEHGAA